MNKIKTNDDVIFIAGKNKGSKGKVFKRTDDKVWVKGCNLQKKHVKPNPQTNEQGGIREIEAPVNVSNLAYMNPETGKPDRVGFKFEIAEDGTTTQKRFLKSNNTIID